MPAAPTSGLEVWYSKGLRPEESSPKSGTTGSFETWYGSRSWPDTYTVLSGPTAFTRSLTGDQPAATGSLQASRRYTRSLSGIQPVLLESTYDAPFTYDDVHLYYDMGSPGTVTWEEVFAIPRAVAGAQPEAGGTLTRRWASKSGLTGAQPSSGGTLAFRRGYGRSLTGAQLSATAVLTKRKIVFKSLTGDQPTATAVLSKILHALVHLDGSQLAPGGEILRGAHGYVRSLNGLQDPPSGEAANPQRYYYTLEGFQPIVRDNLYEDTGVIYEDLGATYESLDAAYLSWHAGRFRALEGFQPLPEGLSYEPSIYTYDEIAVAYEEPGGAGFLTWKFAPDFWAIYRTSIDGTPEEVIYTWSIDENVTLYETTTSDERVVYTFMGPRVYTKP